mgnify:CR=1 FL=1
MSNFPAPVSAIALRLAALRFARTFLAGAVGAALVALVSYVGSVAADTPTLDITKPETVAPALIVVGAGAGLNALMKFLREKGVVTNSIKGSPF